MAKKENIVSTTTQLEKAIESLAIHGGDHFAACFDNFLNLALSYFCNHMNERQMKLRKRVEENVEFKNAYTESLTIYGDLAEGYKDPLGDMFMSRISHGQHGQFFTPESVSLLMTEIVGVEDGAKVNDPACGSGRNLLKALEVARSEGKEIELYANDLSLTCAKMTLLNFMINSVAGEVSCGDALKLDYENFTFFKIDKIRNLATGAVLSTYWEYTLSNVKEIEEYRRKWWWTIAEYGWIKYRKFPMYPSGTKYIDEEGNVSDVKEVYGETECLPHPKEASDMIKNQKIDPLPTEIKVGEDGQLQLF